MKIVCVGRNYVAHAHELGNEVPGEPIVFLKPETALVKNNQPFYYPDFSNDIHYEVEVIARICKVGKYIAPEFAHKYYDAIGVGIDFTARDLQQKAKEKGLPWDLAKGFNGSAPVSSFVDVKNYKDLKNLTFALVVNGELKQEGNTSLMIFPVNTLIAYISRFITLKKGDIIFTGTPKGVGPVKIGDRLEAFLEGEKLLEVEIK